MFFKKIIESFKIRDNLEKDYKLYFEYLKSNNYLSIENLLKNNPNLIYYKKGEKSIFFHSLKNNDTQINHIISTIINKKQEEASRINLNKEIQKIKSISIVIDEIRNYSKSYKSIIICNRDFNPFSEKLKNYVFYSADLSSLNNSSLIEIGSFNVFNTDFEYLKNELKKIFYNVIESNSDKMANTSGKYQWFIFENGLYLWEDKKLKIIIKRKKIEISTFFSRKIIDVDIINKIRVNISNNWIKSSIILFSNDKKSFEIISKINLGTIFDVTYDGLDLFYDNSWIISLAKELNTQLKTTLEIDDILN